MEKNTGIRFAAGKHVLWFVILNRSLGQADDTSGKTERYEFSQEQANAPLDCDAREGKGEGVIFPSPAGALGEWRRLIGLFLGRDQVGKKRREIGQEMLWAPRHADPSQGMTLRPPLSHLQDW